jgi:hypothetical protein
MLSAIAAIGAWYYAYKADNHLQDSNSIAQTSVAQTNSIAQTSVAQTNSIAQTSVAQSDSLNQKANSPDIQNPESYCFQSGISVAVCKSKTTLSYIQINVHDQFIFKNNGGASVSLTRVSLTDEYNRQYIVELYNSSTNNMCPEPLETIALALPLDVLPHKEFTWYMKGTYQDSGFNLTDSLGQLRILIGAANYSLSNGTYNVVPDGTIHISGINQVSNEKNVMSEYSSLNGKNLHLTWTFDFSYGGKKSETTVTNLIFAPSIDLSQSNPVCQLDSQNP